MTRFVLLFGIILAAAMPARALSVDDALAGFKISKTAPNVYRAGARSMAYGDSSPDTTRDDVRDLERL